MRYDYVSSDETIRVERSYPMASAPKRITVKGRVLYKAAFCRGVAVQGGGGTTMQKTGTGKSFWQVSNANGCHPNQVKEIRELDQKLGAPQIDYAKTKGGMMAACFESPTQKNNWLRAHKRYDADAGYSAPCPGDFKKQYPEEAI